MEYMTEIGDGILMVCDGSCLKLINTATGKERVLSSHDGKLLVNDSEIDFDALSKAFGEGKGRDKSIRYGLNRYSDFKNGICAFCWTIYPDGMWFADSDGYGMQDNKEETAYCIMNCDLEMLMPFKPIKDISETLKLFQKDTCQPQIETIEISQKDTEMQTALSDEEKSDPFSQYEDDERALIESAMNTIIEITDDIFPSTGFDITPDLWKQTEADPEDLITVPICPDIEKKDKIESYEEIKLGEHVLIYCGENDRYGGLWWEVEFDTGVFCGPRVWDVNRGNWVVFKLKSLKKGEFKIRVMEMMWEPDDNGGTDKVVFEFNVYVRVL